jgi:LacI family transcriptional regulator
LQLIAVPVKPFTMTTNLPKVTTLKQLAERAGLSLAAVSYALRDDEKIPEPTRRRVHNLARQLGYRPNPRIAALMAHIRRSHGPSAGERIAFVWVHTPREESRRDSFLQLVFHGARQRAEQLGYNLEEFYLEESGINARRLADILRARGITGVVFSPVMHETTVRLDFTWEDFSCAVIGHTQWHPELHHAGHHHYHAMRCTLEELAALGYKRPAVILDAAANERGRRAWQAAFLVFHPLQHKSAPLVLRDFPATRQQLMRWLKSSCPDVVILHRSEMVTRFSQLCPASKRPGICTLHWSPDLKNIAGIDQRFDLVASNAVDLVVNQLITNERGAPLVPRVTLFSGQWVPSHTLTNQSPVRRKTEQARSTDLVGGSSPKHKSFPRRPRPPPEFSRMH